MEAKERIAAHRRRAAELIAKADLDLDIVFEGLDPDQVLAFSTRALACMGRAELEERFADDIEAGRR